MSEATERAVTIPIGNVALDGDLAIPKDAKAIVAFAHGSGSSRRSSRNRYVAEFLRGAGLGTLLFDLLTVEEEQVDSRTGHLRFDIGLLADRLGGAMKWLENDTDARGLSVGLFGASTGGGAALVAAARHPERVGAVVSRGGRPDLAGADLPRVRAPTLLIVGSRDEPVIRLNEDAMRRMVAPVELEIVPGATHLFEEPGTLEQVARLARSWFTRYLAAGIVGPPPA
jgi:putative phosphoribosyl transferase